MIKVIPAERHLLGLLCHPDRLDDAAVRDVMLSYFHYCPSEAEISLRRRRQLPPPDFDPYNPRHRSSVAWLRTNRIYSLYRSDRPMDEAFQLLMIPPARLLVEVFLIQRSRPEDIVKAMARQFGFACSVQAVVKYRHFFFDVGRMDRLDLIQALTLSDSRWQLSLDKNITSVHAAVETAARELDPRICVARNPTSVFAKKSALAQCGYSFESSINDLPAMMSESLVLISSRIGEEAMSRSPSAARNASRWANTFDSVWEARLAMQSPDKALLDDFNHQLTMEADNTVLPSVHQLPAGDRRTLDLQPSPKTETIDDREAAFNEGPFGGSAVMEDVGDDIGEDSAGNAGEDADGDADDTEYHD